MAIERTVVSPDPGGGSAYSLPSYGVREGLPPLEPPYWYSLSPRYAGKTIRIARRALWSFHAPSEWEFVQGVLGQLARWVLDLPASEKHHHSIARGLYRHSLEVAALSVFSSRRPEPTESKGVTLSWCHGRWSLFFHRRVVPSDNRSRPTPARRFFKEMVK
jgi:hypothetical protein